MATFPQGDKCNTLFYKHKCLEAGENDEDIDELTVRVLTVTEDIIMSEDNSNITMSGDNSTFTMTGENSTMGLTGDNSDFTVSGANSNISLTGDDSHLIVSGVGSCVDFANGEAAYADAVKLEVDIITGDGGCEDVDYAPSDIFINADPTIRDNKQLFVQHITQVNDEGPDPPRGTGVTITGDVHHGFGAPIADSEGRFRMHVKEIRDLDNLSYHTYIPYIGVKDIDAPVEDGYTGGIIVRAETQFVNGITFDNPPLANFAYDNATVAVQFEPIGGVGVIPSLALGNVRFHRFGDRGVNPMVTMIWGNASVVMANAPFTAYRDDTVVPLGFRPVLDTIGVIATYRNADAALFYQGFMRVLSDGTLIFTNEADDQGLSEGWFNTDNGANCGTRAGTMSWEAAPS